MPWRKLVPAYGYVLNATQLITLVSDYADMKARLESMQAQQTLARAKLDRDKGLYRDRQNISQEQFQETTARFQSNSAMVKAEQVRVNNALNIIRQQFGSVISDATEKYNFHYTVTSTTSGLGQGDPSTRHGSTNPTKSGGCDRLWKHGWTRDNAPLFVSCNHDRSCYSGA